MFNFTSQGPWAAATAINEFKKQFKAKTAADWASRKTMVAKSGKYMWLERDFENQDEEMEDAKPEKGKAREKTPEVKAAPEVQVCNSLSELFIPTSTY